MKLKSCFARKTDTCLTYALKRIGRCMGTAHTDNLLININEITYPDLISGDYFEAIDFNPKDCTVSDLLLWDKKVEEVAFPLEITTNGKVLSRKIWKGFHVAVVEENGIYSDYDGTKIKLVSFDDGDFTRPDKILKQLSNCELTLPPMS